MRALRMALAQVNATVGAFDANVARVRDALARAEAQGADVVLFPELVLCGYPPEDLLLKSDFLEANRHALEDLAGACRRITAVVGFADRQDDVYNAAASKRICLMVYHPFIKHSIFSIEWLVKEVGVNHKCRFCKFGRCNTKLTLKFGFQIIFRR